MAIVSFGIETATGDEVYRRLADYGYTHQDVNDLRWKLKNPRDNTARTQHEVDGMNDWTQRAIFGQSNFFQVVQEDVSLILSKTERGNGLMHLEGCRTGWHRAYTLATELQEILNRITVNGRRLFNAMHFPLCNVKPRDVREHLQLAARWSQSPWSTARGKQHLERENLYAYDGCAQRPNASDNFHKIWDWVDNRLIPRLNAAAAKHLEPAHEEQEEKEEENQSEEDEKKDKHYENTETVMMGTASWNEEEFERHGRYWTYSP